MKEYSVEFEMTVHAENWRDACQKAWDDLKSLGVTPMATVIDLETGNSVNIDLQEEDSGEEIGIDACNKLVADFPSASWEYPGFISITNKDGTQWAIGMANGPWEMDLCEIDGNCADASFNLGHPKTGAELAELIMKHIDRRK